VVSTPWPFELSLSDLVVEILFEFIDNSERVERGAFERRFPVLHNEPRFKRFALTELDRFRYSRFPPQVNKAWKIHTPKTMRQVENLFGSL
jgi:hypothetical protein